MGASCSRKRGQSVDEDVLHMGYSGRYCKSGSSKLLGNSFCPTVNAKQGGRRSPSLMELCVNKFCQEIDKYNDFSMIPRDISQQIFNKLVYSQRLTDIYLKAFRDCALRDIYLGEYPGVDDSWMEVVSSQGSSLLSADVSCSEITDSGSMYLKDCTNLQALIFNFCDNISDSGLKNISARNKGRCSRIC